MKILLIIAFSICDICATCSYLFIDTLIFAVPIFFIFRQLRSTITRNLSLASDAKIIGQFFGQAGVSLVQYFSGSLLYFPISFPIPEMSSSKNDF